MAEINNLFSTYIDSSELSLINISQDSIIISNDFLDLYLKALNIYELSDGSFDFSVLSLIEEWGFGNGFNVSNIPSDSTIENLLINSDVDKLKINNNYLVKESENVKIDFSAIAKGWAVDQIALFLKSNHISDFMIEVGGEITVSGYNQYGSLWSIGISDPDNNSYEILATLPLTDISIATSGTYNNSFTIDGLTYSHIINPITGYPIIHDLVSATILADECVMADAIATAVMVKGFKAGLEWINTLPDTECFLIKKEASGEYIYAKSAGFNFEL